MPIVRIGICAPRSAMKSKRSAADERVEAPCAEFADLRLQLRHPPRREDPREQAAVDGVGRRVLEDEDPRRHLDVRPDELEDAALARDEGLRVEQARSTSSKRLTA